MTRPRNPLLRLAPVAAAIALLSAGCALTSQGGPDGLPWPSSVCTCETTAPASAWLDQIYILAEAAPPVPRDQIRQAVAKCRADSKPTSLPFQKHCDFVWRAYQAALAQNWPACRTELNHGH